MTTHHATARRIALTPEGIRHLINNNPGVSAHDLKRDLGPKAVEIANGLTKLGLVSRGNPYSALLNNSRRYWPIARLEPNTFGPPPKTGSPPMNPPMNPTVPVQPGTTQRPLLDERNAPDATLNETHLDTAGVKHRRQGVVPSSEEGA